MRACQGDAVFIFAIGEFGIGSVEREDTVGRQAGVDAARMDAFLDDAFFRMNLGGARRAFTPRESRP
jgi:hypothetical protein